jgi:flavorubredoxin
MYINITKTINSKSIDNIILNGENLNPFSLISGMRQGFPPSTLLFNLVMEFLSRATRQEEEIKGIQISKETVKISLSAHNMILYLKDQRKLHSKTSRQHK